MKSKSAKAVLVSIIISLVIVIAVSLVLLLWALPSGVIESVALAHFLTALVPVLGVSLIMAISSLWIKAGKKKKQPPFDEDVIKEPSSYDSPLYGDLDADDYVAPFKVKSMTPADWDYIEEFEGLPEKQKKRILASMKKPIERPDIKFEDLSANYPFTESFDFYNVPFDTFAFDKPEVPKITPFVEKEKEEEAPLEEFPFVEFGKERLFESPLAPSLRNMLFNPEYSIQKLDDEKVLIAKNDDFKLKRPIYRLTAAEGAIDFVWHKDEKERESNEAYIAPSMLWKMIGEFLIKLKPVNVKKAQKTIAPSVQKIESENDIERKKALATVEESIDAYALLSLPENVEENPEALEAEEEVKNAIPIVKYASDGVVNDGASTEEAFSSLMSPSSEVYKASAPHSYNIKNADIEKSDEVISADEEAEEENEPVAITPSAHLEVTSGIYDISYHEEFENESEEVVYKYDHSKKEEPLPQAKDTSKEEVNPTYTETLPENPLFSLDENTPEEGSDAYTIKYTHDELPPFTTFEFDVEKPQAKSTETKVNEQSIVPVIKNEVALKEFDAIIPFDDNREIQVKEKGEIAHIQSSEVSPTLPPFDSFEFEVSSPNNPMPPRPDEDKDKHETEAVLSDFPEINAENNDYRNDLLDSFNALKRNEEVPSFESADTDKVEAEEDEVSEPKYVPNKPISENPTLDEAYDAFMKCGVFTDFAFDVEKAQPLEKKVYDIPEGREEVQNAFASLPLPEKMPLTRAKSIVPFSWLEDKGEALPEEEYIAPTEEQIAKGEFAAKLSPSKADENRENSLVPEFDELYTPSDMYDKVLSLKHRESYEALPLPEKMPLTRAKSIVPFSWLEDKGEALPEEEYIAPTEEQIAKGEFAAKLSPSKADENKENSLVPEFDELYTPSDMYDKVLSLKHRESYEALPLPEKMPLTRARSIVPFSWLEDKGEALPEEEYIAPTEEQIAKGEFAAKLSPVDISKLPEEKIASDTEIENATIENKDVLDGVEEASEEDIEELIKEAEKEPPQTFIEAFNDILEIEMSEAKKFDYELTIARIISEKADDIARLDLEAMAFMEDTDKLCIIFPCQTKNEATELIRLIKDAVGDKNMKVRIAELRKRGITAAVFSLEIFK